jgi:RNA polymerase sigma-70 factor (ECF subfamily)
MRFWRVSSSMTAPAIEHAGRRFVTLSPVMAPFRQRSERRLVAGLRAGDPEALRTLHTLHGPAVFGYLLAALRNRAAAEDVFQEVFLQAWRRADTYDPLRGELRTWLLVIARSRALDHHRRRIPEPHDPASGSLTVLEPDASSETDELLESWRFAGLLERLPEQERDLLRRRFYEGRSQTEISRETGIPLGTVKMRMVDGLRRLRRLMEDGG